MKKILSLFAVLVFWGSCKTAPVQYVPEFTAFEVRKITAKGIESFTVSPSKGEWPEVKFFPAQPNTIKSARLKMAVIGDTGCRLKDSALQNCADAKEWPYKKIIESMSKETFDLAVHTGDFHYREYCHNPVLCSAYSQSIGYGWNTWWDDFFGPTQSLFRQAPLLLVRGNHEDCKRAYSGWNPLSPLNKQFTESCEEVEPYQWIEMQDLVFINFDDSGFDDRKESKPEDREKYLNILKDLSRRVAALKGKKEVWFLAHKPVYGHVPDKQNNLVPFAIKALLKTLMDEAKLTEYIDYNLSGHIHNQQLVVNKADLLQIIVGHSGTALDPFGKKMNTDSIISSTETAYHFGYAIFERKGFKNWNFIFKTQEGKTELECSVQNKTIKCN